MMATAWPTSDGAELPISSPQPHPQVHPMAHDTAAEVAKCSVDGTPAIEVQAAEANDNHGVRVAVLQRWRRGRNNVTDQGLEPK